MELWSRDLMLERFIRHRAARCVAVAHHNAMAAELEYAKAELAFLRVTRLFSQIGTQYRAAEAAFWHAFCVEKQGRMDEARRLYEDVLRHYANSTSAREAKRRISGMAME